MSTKKLTLSADSELVSQAKQLAQQRGTSLSAMFDRFLRSLVLQEHCEEPPGPLTRQALGLVQLPPDRTDDELLEEALADEHQR